jgi:acetyltransferase-like isoleucine patch superfamily enzyme
VMLDDRGELVIKKGTSLSDYAAVYSHAHHPKNQSDVQNRRTEIGPGARITFHAAVMAGVNVGENAILGAMGVATKDIEANSIAGGIPAKQIKTKDDVESDGWEENEQQQ